MPGPPKDFLLLLFAFHRPFLSFLLSYPRGWVGNQEEEEPQCDGGTPHGFVKDYLLGTGVRSCLKRHNCSRDPFRMQ